MSRLCTILLLSCVALTLNADPRDVRVTILSDAFGADAALHKDWGFSALVEAGGKRILFDTGNDSAHFAANVRRLDVNLSNLDFAVISHRHGDHTDGLRHLLKVNPKVTIYVPADEYFGGPTPQRFFRNSDDSLPRHMRYFDGAVPERVPHGTPWKDARFTIVAESREMPEGAVIVVGCSHPGITRILDSASAKTEPVRLLVGGLHLVTTTKADVEQLATSLRDEWKLAAIAPGHCTGEHAFTTLRRIRRSLSLRRSRNGDHLARERRLTPRPRRPRWRQGRRAALPAADRRRAGPASDFHDARVIPSQRRLRPHNEHRLTHPRARATMPR